MLLHFFLFNSLFFFPGLLRSNLIATSNHTLQYCSKPFNHTKIWINLSLFFPTHFNCFLQTMTIPQPPGLEINVEKFGDINPLLSTYQFLSFKQIGTYFNNLYEILKSKFNNFFGISYDFRYGLNQPKLFFKNIQELIEQEVYPVSIVSHSFG